MTGHPKCTAKGVYDIKTMGDRTPTTCGEGCLLHKIHGWQYTHYVRRRVFITKKKEKEKKHEWHYTHDMRRRVFFLLQNKQENMDDRTPTMYGVWVPRRSTSTVTGFSAWRGARESWGDRAEDGRRGIYFSQFKRYLLIWIIILLHHKKKI